MTSSDASNRSNARAWSRLEHPRFTNALIHETSPYLLQHAHNPVNWQPWGEQAFQAARERDVPIFLSIGYSTCYWCHVMEREVFEDPAIAEPLNEQFVCIKVDREQRPDVDELYMTATQVMTRRGGWPMSVFLTPPVARGAGDPGLGPFWCGTYIPPKPMHGLAGFPQVIDSLSRAWREQRNEITAQAQRVAQIVAQSLSADAQPQLIDPQMIDRAVEAISATYDREHGGFGNAPKFPTPSTPMLLLSYQQRTQSQPILEMLDHSLDRMARGGIFDQVGGGFHRYSVDEQWLVPHFEKMLYDNGQLAELYADFLGHHAPDDKAHPYRDLLRELCDYVLREMTDPTGAFWSAQDAEVDTREGQNYLWTSGQVKAALDTPDLAEHAIALYGLDLGTNFQDPHHREDPPTNVLFMPRSIASFADAREINREQAVSLRKQINEQLLRVRACRQQPATDDKVLTAWNGMMIAGLAKAGAILGEPRFIDAASRAADAVLKHLTIPDDEGGGLYRTYRAGVAGVPGFLDDYAHFVHGLIELHRNQERSHYLTHAERLTNSAIDRFAHPIGGYYDTLADQPDLFVRTRSVYDGATATGNSQMIHNLIDLSMLTRNTDDAERAGRDLQSFAKPLAQHSTGMTHMLHAMLRLIEHAPQYLRLREPQDDVRSTELMTAVEPQTVSVIADIARFTLTLSIAEGLHLAVGRKNKLGQTKLSLFEPADAECSVDWPKGQEAVSPFTTKLISVYTGVVTLPITLRFRGTPPPQAQLQLHYQPCTDRACRLPRTLRVTVPLSPS